MTPTPKQTGGRALFHMCAWAVIGIVLGIAASWSLRELSEASVHVPVFHFFKNQSGLFVHGEWQSESCYNTHRFG